MQRKKSVLYVSFIVGLSGLVVGADAEAGGHNHPPSSAAIAFAERTSDLMTNTVVAALIQEIDETTPANVAEGNQSISLIFDDANLSMRLVGTLDPLQWNDLPRDDFEDDALDDALSGMPRVDVERVQGKWYYRRSIPLSNFKTQCGFCHTSFQSLPSTAWVGALMLRVPIAGN